MSLHHKAYIVKKTVEQKQGEEVDISSPRELLELYTCDSPLHSTPLNSICHCCNASDENKIYLVKLHFSKPRSALMPSCAKCPVKCPGDQMPGVPQSFTVLATCGGQ